MRWIRAGATSLDADRVAGYTIERERDHSHPLDLTWACAILDSGAVIRLEAYTGWPDAGGTFADDPLAAAREYIAQLERELADHKDRRCGSRARFTVGATGPAPLTVDATCRLIPGHVGRHHDDCWSWDDDYAALSTAPGPKPLSRAVADGDLTQEEADAFALDITVEELRARRATG